jgi:hypothetical protein
VSTRLWIAAEASLEAAEREAKAETVKEAAKAAAEEAARAAVVAYNWIDGLKSTINLRELFGLLGHALQVGGPGSPAAPHGHARTHGGGRNTLLPSRPCPTPVMNVFF